LPSGLRDPRLFKQCRHDEKISTPYPAGWADCDAEPEEADEPQPKHITGCAIHG
jgi:hypothetical protein